MKQRVAVVAISWIGAFVFLLITGTLLREFDWQSKPKESMIEQHMRDGRSLWCVFVDRGFDEMPSRWIPSQGPLPLSEKAAMAIASPEIDRLTARRSDIYRLDPRLVKVGMGKHPERGDLYYYRFDYGSLPGKAESEIGGVVFVFLDRSVLKSRSTGCPVPRFGIGYGFLDDIHGAIVVFATIGFAVLVTFFYAPLAILINRRIRKRLLFTVATVAVLAAAMGFARAWMGEAYPLLALPSGVEFAILLGALPGMLFVEFLVRRLVTSLE
jgi:hypothetical protein